MRCRKNITNSSRLGAWGFSLAELLVVIGVITLLLSLTIPVLQRARNQAQQAVCKSNLMQLGIALENCRSNYDYYPLWDDNGNHLRYTWIDILVQLRFFTDHRGGYCAADPRPDRNNQARAQFHGLIYPNRTSAPGVDYSYFIAAPLAAGGWSWQEKYAPANDLRPRVFEHHEEFPSQRVLAGDGSWPCGYNFSSSTIWNDPTQFDNTVAYRHPRFQANLLMQDNHVDSITCRPGVNQEGLDERVNTHKYFFWYPGELMNVGPDHRFGNNWYPNTPPFVFHDGVYDGIYPNELNPRFYTDNKAWTLINHKGW